jgi:hypothetical protein
MSNFLATQPTDENYWRGIVLLGRNVATYKLALAKSLLELGSAGKTFVTLDELAIPYTRHLTTHLKHSDKQINARSSSFLDVCRRFSASEATQSQLIESAVNMGFNNVIDAFHIVNRGEVPAAPVGIAAVGVLPEFVEPASCAVRGGDKQCPALFVG